MEQRHRVRWSYAIGTALLAPALGGAVIVLLLRPLALGLTVAVLIGGGNAVLTVRRMRRRWLRIEPDALEVQRDHYAIRVTWDDITQVHRRSAQLVLAVDELVLSHSEVIARDSRGRVVSLPDFSRGGESAERIQISVYDKHWRSGPIGEQLRNKGIALDVAPPS